MGTTRVSVEPSFASVRHREDAIDPAHSKAAGGKPTPFDRIRPVEFIIGLFALFVVLKAGPAALGSFTSSVVARAQLLLVMLVLVSEVLLARRAWVVARTWKGSASLKGWLTRLVPVVLTPMIVASALVVTSAGSQQVEADGGSRVLLVLTALAHALALTSLPWVLWLAVWVDAAHHERFDASRLVRSSLRGVLEAARDWLPLVVMISGYSWMGAVMELRPVTSADATLAAIDRAMFMGHDPVEALQAVISAPLSEYLAFSYSFYALLFPICFGAIDGVAGRAAFRETAFTVSLGLLLAYVSYTLVPAKGPVFSRSFEVPLDLYFVGSIKAGLMDLSRITWDCFPSMHTALTVVMLEALRRHVRPVFWLVLPVTWAIPFACVYLRYHYVIDVLAGLGFAVVLIAVSRRVFRSGGRDDTKRAAQPFS